LQSVHKLVRSGL